MFSPAQRSKGVVLSPPTTPAPRCKIMTGMSDPQDHNGYTSFIMGMQGSITRDGVIIEGASRLLCTLKERNVPFVILTNEDRESTSSLVTKLNEQLSGVELDEHHFWTSTDSACEFFGGKLRRSWKGSIYVIGEGGFLSALKETFKAHNGPANGAHVLTLDEKDPAGMNPVDFVVVGSVYSTSPSSTKFLQSLERACGYSSAGAKLVSSCPDDFDILPNGNPSCGCPGPSVALLERVTGKGSYSLGKPKPNMIWSAWKKMAKTYQSVAPDLRLSDALFVGDGLDTDIRLALEHDVDCALVLSGTTQRSELAHSPLIPTFVFDSIVDMCDTYIAGKLMRTCAGFEPAIMGSAVANPSDKSSTYKSFLFDMDGVIQRFGVPIPGAAEMLRGLLEKKVPFMILTNEDRYTNEKLLDKLHGMLDGVKLDPRHLVTASNSARLFFQKKLARGWRGSVYVLGEEGLLANTREAFEGYEGICVITGQEDEPADVAKIDFVVIGSVYARSANGEAYLRNLERAIAYVTAGAKVISSCPDDYEVTEAGEVRLGSPGLSVSALKAITRHSSYSVGKPNPQMLWSAWSSLQDLYGDVAPDLDFSEAIFIGDSLGTDIRTSLEHELDCALVLSGTTTAKQLAASALTPTFVFDSIANLDAAWKDGTLTRPAAQK